MRISILLLVLFFSKINAQVTLSGNAPSYAGKVIVFSKYADPFTETEIEIGNCTTDLNGDFTVKLPVQEVTYVFSHLGIFKGSMFVEPGKSYIISFPDKTEKSAADKLNPFFNEKEFHFPIKNLDDKDLNFLIMSFNDAYSPYYRKFAMNLNSKKSRSMIDTTVSALKKLNGPLTNSFYDSYVDYKIGYLKHLSYQQKSKSVAKEYFRGRPILYSNLAYTDLFNQLFNKYFYYFGQTTLGKDIYQDINKDKSYYKLNRTLQLDSLLSEDSFRELVILKNIHDEFYSDKFSRSGLLNILDSVESQSKIGRHIEIAKFIRAKITRLMTGFAPPGFELFDKDKKLVRLSDFIGKYVYLNFCTCSNYSCIKEFDLLKPLSEKYKDKLVVVTISTDDNLEVMANYVNKTKPNWIFLHYGNLPDIIKLYDIRAYPTYFLIDPKGLLVLSPAASPGESFEMFLFQIMKQRGEI